MTTIAHRARKWNERPSALNPEIMESESMFRLLFERSADAIWLFDPAVGMFVECNQAAVELMGAKTREELLQVRPADLAPPFQADGQSSEVRAAEITAQVAARGGHRFEWLARRLDGRDVPLEVLATPIAANGRAVHVIVARDITERRRAENELRESEQLLASIADNLSEAIYRTGPDHELIFANRAYLWLSGYDSLAEMRSVPREQFYADPADRARLLDLLTRTGTFRNEEIEYVRRDGRHWWGLSNSLAVRDSRSGEVLYHVGSVSDITELKKAKQDLEQLNASLERRIIERTLELTTSEARLRTLVEHAPEAIVVFDGATGRFLSGNALACRLYGRGADELTQLSPREVSPEFQADGRRSADVAREKMNEALAGGAPVFEWLHRHSSGRIIRTEVRLVRLPAEGKTLLRASIIDNTERNRREKIQQATFQISEAAHRAEDLDGFYRQIHEIVRGLMAAENFYIALLDATNETFSFPYFVDERDERPARLRLSQGLTGYVLRTGKPLLARDDNIVRDEAGVAVVAGETRKTAYAEVGAPAAVWLGVPLNVQGRRIGVMALQDYRNKEAYGEEEKRILNFVATQVAQAIERKRAEQALRESEQKFRALFEASSQGVMLHDEFKYLEVNPAAVRILGYHHQGELIGRNPQETSPPTQPNGEDSGVLARRYIEECLTNGSARFEWIARHARGHDIPLEVVLTRVEWGGRQIIQAFIHDISERKKAEAELLKSLAREKELGQLKSNFVSMVSHEFRTPLGVIMSSAEILDAYLEQLSPEERREQLQSIKKNSRRMANLMEEVLLLGMVEAGKMEFKPAPVDLSGFCRRLVNDLQSATNNKCPVNLSLPAGGQEAFADERLLDHIFTNLLSNAVKFSPEGSPVEFALEREGGQAVCSVRDQGMGVPEADLERMFSAFHRGRNAGHVPGTGLGLTIVKRCVELHHGKIRVESTVGQGTTVTVRLPVFP